MIPYLKQNFAKFAVSQDRAPMEAYMKNRFSFYGLKKPLRAQIQKQAFKQFPLHSVEELEETLEALWCEDKRELHYVAMELGAHYQKLFTEESLRFFEKMIRTHSWWDSIDRIAPTLVGALLLRYPDLTSQMEVWINDEDMWIRRSALIYQLKYKKRTDTEQLFDFCKRRMHEKEFFIRKAIGWVLREHSKTDAKAVQGFMEEFREKLSPLSVREGSKYLYMC